MTEPLINGKPWFKSKTLWFNALALVLGMAEMQFKLLEQYIPAAVFPALAFVLAVVNVLLRFITTTALIVPRVEQAAPPAPPVPPAQGGFISLAWLPALKWLGAALLLGWVVYQVYGAGRAANEAKWLAKQAEQTRVDQGERDRLAKLGQIAATHEIQSQEREAARNRQLNGVFHAVRKQFSLVAPAVDARQSNLLAHGARPAGYPDRCGPAASSALAQGQPAAPLQAAPEPHGLAAGGVDSGGDLNLTLGAVWLWNAALSSEASGAAGACRVDAATGQAAAACAESSGLDLDAAWANHTANAQACAADRARHQRLIDYLDSLPQPLSK